VRSAPLVAALAATIASPAFAAGVTPVRAGTTNPTAASALSLGSRQGAKLGRTSALTEGNGGWIIGALGVAAGVTFAFIRKADQDNDQPASN